MKRKEKCFSDMSDVRMIQRYQKDVIVSFCSPNTASEFARWLFENEIREGGAERMGTDSDTVYDCPDCGATVIMTDSGGSCNNPSCPSNGD